MTNEEYSRKSIFLYNAIKDAQDLIRFYDTKAGVAVVIVAAMWAYYIKLIPEFINSLCCCCLVIFLNPFLILCNMTLVTYLIYKIIFPQVNPASSISPDSITDEEKKVLDQNLFFVPQSSKSKHKNKFGEYYSNLKNLDEESELKVLAYELLKISFIRNLKHKRCETMAKALIILGLHYFIFIFIHYIITRQCLYSMI